MKIVTRRMGIPITLLRNLRTRATPRWAQWGVLITPGIPILIVGSMVVVGALAPILAPHDPIAANLAESNRPPAWAPGGDSSYWLGTDRFGRDILSRLIHGARVTLIVVAATLLLGGGFGASLGIVSGNLGGKVDALIMRVVDVFMGFPTVLLALIFAVILGAQFINVVVVVSLTIWPRFARLARGDTLAIKQLDYVVYARTIGTPSVRLMWKHIFPNLVSTLLVVSSWEVGHVILMEASLSFLGAGLPPHQPSWGTMVADGRGLLASAWWISLFPGLAITLVVLSVNTFGDWLRDWLDPAQRAR